MNLHNHLDFAGYLLIIFTLLFLDFTFGSEDPINKYLSRRNAVIQISDNGTAGLSIEPLFDNSVAIAPAK